MSAWDAACADYDLPRSKSRRIFAFDQMRVGKAGDACVLVDRHTSSLEVFAQERLSANRARHLAHTAKQAEIVECWLADTDAVEV